MPRPLSDSPNPGASLRATSELARDAARSDALIAQAARCTDRTVLRCRRALEASGVIEPVPSRQRAWRTQPSRNPGAYERAIAQVLADPRRTVREIAEAARCTHPTVLRALRARAARTADLAAALGVQLALSGPRPCCPLTPAGGLAFGVGWQRESPAALNLCNRWCPAVRACREWAVTQPDAPACSAGSPRRSAVRPGYPAVPPPRRILAV
jgi:hypothetical protein